MGMTALPAPQHIDPRRALTASAICWSGFVLVWLAMRAGWLAELDRSLLLAVYGGGASPRLSEAVRDITALGGVTLRNAAVLLAAGFLVALRRWRLAAWLVAVVLAGWLFNTGLKVTIDRPRPELLPHLMHAGGYSFPSGHSFNGTLAWTAIALAFAPLIPRQPLRIALLVCAVVLGALIAFSRVWLSVHWPSDALAGWLGALGWVCGFAALLARLITHPAHPEPVEGCKRGVSHPGWR